MNARDRPATWFAAESLRCSFAWHELSDFAAHAPGPRPRDAATGVATMASQGEQEVFDNEQRSAALLGRRTRRGRWPFALTPSASHHSAAVGAAPSRGGHRNGETRRAAQPRRARGFSEADAADGAQPARGPVPPRELTCSQIAVLDCAVCELRLADPALFARAVATAGLLPLVDALVGGGAVETPPVAVAGAATGGVSLHARATVQRASAELRAPPNHPSHAHPGASQVAVGARVCAHDICVALAVRRGGGDWLSDGALGSSVGASLSAGDAGIALDGHTICSVRRLVLQGRTDSGVDFGDGGNPPAAQEYDASGSVQCASLRAAISPQRAARLAAAALAKCTPHCDTSGEAGEFETSCFITVTF